jgi:hypothetical protein
MHLFKEGNMKRVAGMALILMGMAAFAMAYIGPEIDPGSAGSALALLAGVALVIRGRRRN